MNIRRTEKRLGMALIGVITLAGAAVAPAEASPVQPRGEGCDWTGCGIVHNASGGLILIRRNYGGPGICLPDQERWLASGHYSNEKVTGRTTWDDTDCLMTPRVSVCVDGVPRSQGYWIRVHNSWGAHEVTPIQTCSK
ncbi:hypothetical protein [Amycolatopsis sp. WGS_07]|uniref:hypothetical protein n=1 Tax=Amycolatopsis sp. WGS_07 TaxID=3076764 RepID=UPI003873A210